MEAEITNATKKGKTVGKKRILQLLLAIALIGGSAYLLKVDVLTFWTWWLLEGELGLKAGFFPKPLQLRLPDFLPGFWCLLSLQHLPHLPVWQ